MMPFPTRCLRILKEVLPCRVPSQGPALRSLQITRPVVVSCGNSTRRTVWFYKPSLFTTAFINTVLVNINVSSQQGVWSLF